MAPKLTSCDVFGMLLKYWLLIEGVFVGGESSNPIGVLVSGGLRWCLMSGVVTGAFASVMFADCVAVLAAAAADAVG